VSLFRLWRCVLCGTVSVRLPKSWMWVDEKTHMGICPMHEWRNP